MRTEKHRFPGAFGYPLSARLDRPDGDPVAHALFAHCFTGGKDFKTVRRIAHALVDEGIGVLTFDVTGLGESEGDFGATNFSSNLDDLCRAAEWLAAHAGGPEILVGHSLGGAAVLGAAHRIPASRVVATIGAPADPEHLVETLGPAAQEADARGEASVLLAGRRFCIKKQLLDDLRANDLDRRIADLGKPLLILHSPDDETVSVDEARKIYLAAKHPKSFVCIDGADHLLLRNPRDADFVARVLAAWAARYVGAAG